MQNSTLKTYCGFVVRNKNGLSHLLSAGISLALAISMFLVPSVSMGVVIDQNAASGVSQGPMAGFQHPNDATFPSHKNAPGQLEVPGQKYGKDQDQLPQYIPGEVLVKFKNGVDDGKKKNIHDKMDADVLSEIRQIGVHKVKSKRGLSTEELIRQYKNDPDVLFAEPNGIFHAQYNRMLPNDPFFTNLWGMSNIDAPEAWSLQTGGGVIVAVIDTGVDYTHPDLAANMVAGWDFTTCAQFLSNGSCATPKARDSDPMDDYGHGTHVAGTIAAIGNNSTGVVGVSMDAKIMPIKALNSQGKGSWSDIAAGIIYASEQGAKISNNSYGGCCAVSHTLDAAIATARQNGTLLFVAAAGNDGSDNDKSPSYPCSSLEPNVICVAATDQNDALARFSNYGATRVDLAASGVSILSTVPGGSCILCSSTGYSYLNGTSMAAPHVAGAAALAMAQFPTYTGDMIKSLLISSVDGVRSLAGKVATSGRLNVNNALRPGVSISPAPVSVPAGQSVTSIITVQSLNNFSGTVSLSFSSTDPNITGSLNSSSVTLANDSKIATLAVFTTAGMTAGVYSLTVSGTFTNSVGEAETRVGVVAVTVQTDLAVTTALSSASQKEAGGWFTVTDTVQNQGSGLAKGFYVGYYLSTDNVIADTDVRIGSRWIPSLSSGATNSGNTDVWIPAELSAGLYYIAAIVDDTNKVYEFNDSNNSMTANMVAITGPVSTPAEWVKRHNGPANNSDVAYKINLDTSGNSVVSGAVCTFYDSVANRCSNFDVSTIKYSPEGATLWTATYDGGSWGEGVVGQTVDGSGNAYVATKSCTTPNCTSVISRVIKYDANGNTLWQSPVVYSWAEIYGLAVDSAGNAYLTGGAGTADRFCIPQCVMTTVKFAANDGRQLWEQRETAPAFYGARAIAVDRDGYVYITGIEGNKITTLKYGPDGGGVLWKAYFTPPGVVPSRTGLALDTAGNVYVSETVAVPASPAAGDRDLVTIKYDNNGNQLWSRQYDNGGLEVFASLQVDASGNVYVLGESETDKGYAYVDYAIIKYDTNGNFQWDARYSGSGQDIPADLAIDKSGNIYVTGRTTTSAKLFGAQDYATIKYGTDGHPRWYARYDNGEGDLPHAVAVDGFGHVFVTGSSVNPGSNSDFATLKYLTISPDNVVPTVPTGLTAIVVSATQINLSWAASTDNVGVTYYIVYRDGAEFARSYGTNYNDTGLKTLTSYSYTVTACDEAGNCSAQSTSVSATTPDNVPPTVPSGISAIAVSASQINLGWGASTDNVGVTGYTVYRNGVQVGTSSETSYSDTGLTSATTYSYTVAACDAAGNCSAQSTSATATTPDNVPPTVPSGLTASASSSTQINLTWDPATDNVGVTSYTVYRNGVPLVSGNVTSYSDTGLTALTSYSYTVLACDAAVNCSAQSAAVAASTLEGVPPTVPTKLTATAFSTTQINLTWRASTDNVGVTGYKVYRNGVQVGSPSGTSYSDTGLAIATSYQYTVAACDAAGNCSAQSAAVTGTTKRK